MVRPDRVFSSNVLVAVLPLAFVAACPQFDEGGTYRCGADADCPAGASCDVAQQRCVASGADAGETADGGTDAGPGDPCADADFEFEVTRRVSFLFIVDDSGSMMNRQSWWSDRASAFASMFDEVAEDWRVAFTTTDVPANGGRLLKVGGPDDAVVVRSGSGDRVLQLENVLAPGSGGASEGRGLESLSLAFNNPNVTSTKEALHAVDRSLVVVVISDSDDQSTLELDQLQHDVTLPGWDGVTGYFAVGPIDGCQDQYGDAQPGTRYGTFANRLFATRVSLCDTGHVAKLKQTVEVDLGRSVFMLPAGAPTRQPSSVLVVEDGLATERKDEVSFDTSDKAAYFDLPGPPVGSRVCFRF